MGHSDARILVIETSARVGGAGLAIGDTWLAEASLGSGLRHEVELLPAIDRLCREQNWRPADLDHIYVSAGPGSFTGLRVGITVARTLAYAVGAEVVRVPTLDVLARNALTLPGPPEHLAVVLDAKRKQIYAAAFELRGQGYVRTVAAHLAWPAEFLGALPSPCTVLGEGVAYHREAVDAAGAAVADASLNVPTPRAVHVVGRSPAKAGNFEDPAQLVPIYLRRPEAEELWEARQAR